MCVCVCLSVYIYKGLARGQHVGYSPWTVLFPQVHRVRRRPAAVRARRINTLGCPQPVRLGACPPPPHDISNTNDNPPLYTHNVCE